MGAFSSSGKYPHHKPKKNMNIGVSRDLTWWDLTFSGLGRTITMYFLWFASLIDDTYHWRFSYSITWGAHRASFSLVYPCSSSVSSDFYIKWKVIAFSDDFQLGALEWMTNCSLRNSDLRVWSLKESTWKQLNSFCAHLHWVGIMSYSIFVPLSSTFSSTFSNLNHCLFTIKKCDDPTEVCLFVGEKKKKEVEMCCWAIGIPQLDAEPHRCSLQGKLVFHREMYP